MESLSYVLTEDFVSCIHVRVYLFTAAHFHLAASISHFFTVSMKCSCFSSNEIHLPSSFSVIHVSVNIKNNVEKDTIFFFLSKIPGGHAIFLRCIWVGILVELIELFYISVLGRCTFT